MNQFINDISSHSIQYINLWLTESFSKPLDINKNQWLFLIEKIRTLLPDNIELCQDINIEYVKIIIRIYDFLAEILDENHRDSYQCSAMMTRAITIRQCGFKKESDILDIRLITDWFFNGLPYTYEEVIILLNDNKTISELRMLRMIKNRLLVINIIKDNVQSDKDIIKWLRLYTLLP